MIRLLLLGSLLPVLAFGQPFRWTTYTSTSNVVDLTSTDGSVWAATTGGLSGYDVETAAFDVYTNTRGLAMNRSSAVGRDARGWIWIAHFNGAITRVDTETGEVAVIDDLRDEVFEITSILDVGDEVFVSANNGIYRFSYSDLVSNYRVLESIRVLGGFPGSTRVSDLAVAHNYLYAATTFGLARADLQNEFLSAPSAWDNYTTAQGLPENSLAALFGASDGSLWISSAGFLTQFDGFAFAPFSQTGGIIAFAEAGGAVHAATSNIVYQVDGLNLLPVGQPLPWIVDLTAITLDGVQEIVVGIGDNSQTRGGLSFVASGQWSAAVSAHGIAGNFINALAVDPQGRLWSGSGAETPGVSTFDGDQWTNRFSTPETPYWFYGTMPNSFAFDDFGGTWAGSEGGGVAWFREDSIVFFNTTESNGFDVNGARLTLTAGLPNYLVTFVKRNSAGDIYISNRYSATNLPLVRVPEGWIAQGNHPEPWLYYTPRPEDPQGSAHREVVDLLVDQFDRVWVGGHDVNGTANWVFDDRGTAADTTDDEWFSYVPELIKDPLTCYESIRTGVYTWDIDSQGYLWVGWQSGAYYSQAGVPQNLNDLHIICVLDLPVGNQVNAVHVDAHDNRWFGTDNGVAVMDRNFNWIHVFQTADAAENRSDLASNSVTAITSDPVTGDIWIGTTDGLSRLQSPYLSQGGELKELWPYPNPFVANGASRMFIDHERLAGRFDEFRVYTLSGRLVRKLSWSQMINPVVGWDGRNEDGDLVAGGVYLLVASSTDGNSVTGKLAVLGK